MGNQVTLPAGMQIDLGGIAKGYIADELAKMCENRSHGALLNFGGNVYVTGAKPDGSLYRVGVRDPKNTASSLAVISMGPGTVVTSGVYERCFEKDGVFYHHILDPQTGLPAQTGLTSAHHRGAELHGRRRPGHGADRHGQGKGPGLL